MRVKQPHHVDREVPVTSRGALGASLALSILMKKTLAMFAGALFTLTIYVAPSYAGGCGTPAEKPAAKKVTKTKADKPAKTVKKPATKKSKKVAKKSKKVAKN